MKAVMSVVALGLVGLAAAGTKQHAGDLTDPSGNWATPRQGGGGGGYGAGAGWVRGRKFSHKHT